MMDCEHDYRFVHIAKWPGEAMQDVTNALGTPYSNGRRAVVGNVFTCSHCLHTQTVEVRTFTMYNPTLDMAVEYHRKPGESS